MINFDNISENKVDRIKGGEGYIKTRAFDADGIKIMKATLEKGCTIGMHRHETSNETMYILSGEGVYEFEGKAEVMHAGECHYCPKGACHSVRNENDEPLVMLCVIQEL